MIHFKESEFKMGNEVVFDKMDSDFLYLLDELRDECGFPLKINSSFRTEAYNKRIGGAKRSKHLLGLAVDLHCVDSVKRAKLVWYALELGLSVGVAKTFVHIDNRKEQLMFTY